MSQRMLDTSSACERYQDCHCPPILHIDESFDSLHRRDLNGWPGVEANGQQPPSTLCVKSCSHLRFSVLCQVCAAVILHNADACKRELIGADQLNLIET